MRMHGPYLPRMHGPHQAAVVASGREVPFLAADKNWVPSYDAAVGPQLPPQTQGAAYQLRGRDRLQGYLSNPLEKAGQQAIARQLMHAPLGGHVRHALQGQTLPLMDRPVTNMEARIAEQALAGVLATGVGGWGLLSAIDALNGSDPDPQAVYIG